ncbi:hypothetical protein [Actinomadura sp. NBRC 104425]|uniref:hypothetical protein n=1 Tax=Actinomadura sp. NBRC 104425 TaxID=3032204 RepID=UPI0025566CC7|nr:hypothetical protein [Actinomadura sp. NBRC 104425]
MPRPKREIKPSTVRFIAMLRALDLAVDSHGVSHAELERRLCDWLVQGRQAEARLRENPGDADRERLTALVARKNDVEHSGLARADGHRAKAGGQRIGELVSGKFPAGKVPPRRRVEVCVAVLLEFLAENDPDGFADGEYGTRGAWLEWWRQAAQGQEPDIGEGKLHVWGYLDTALEQLRDIGVHVGAGVRAEEPASAGISGLLAERDQALARARQAEKLLDEATARADAAEARADAATAKAEEATAKAEEAATRAQEEARERERAQHQRDEAHHRADRLRKRAAALALPLAALAACAGIAVDRLLLAGRPTRTVEFTVPAQEVTASQQPVFTLSGGLPAGSDWTLRIRLAVTPTDPFSGCTFEMQITAHAEADGRRLPSFTSHPGQKDITQVVHLGRLGSRGVRLVVTRLAVNPPSCTVRLDPSGSRATAPG